MTSRRNCEMGTIAPLIEPKEGYVRNTDGLRCMVVVDPATRKLLIPCEHVYLTRAQQRTTIPSLCQLFLQNRCRFGSQCHQVHADPSIVDELRVQVDSLPCCCPLHGDKDHAGILNKQSSLSNVVLHIPESTYEGGYIPLCRVGYTVPLSKLLNEIPIEVFHRVNQCEDISEEGYVPRVVLEVGTIPICRLHSKSHCSYAEECNFLHLCKEVVEHDADLPLGRRSGFRASQKARSFCVSDPQTPHVLPSFSMSSSNIFLSTADVRSASVRGFHLLQQGGERGCSPTGNSFSLSCDALPWMGSLCSTSGAFGFSREVPIRDRASIASASVSSTPITAAAAVAAAVDGTNTKAITTATTRSQYSPIPAGFERRKVTVEIELQSSPCELGDLDHLVQSEDSLRDVMDFDSLSRRNGSKSGVQTLSSSNGAGFSSSLGGSSRDEGGSTLCSGVSVSHRCRNVGKWRYNPYDGTILRVFM